MSNNYLEVAIDKNSRSENFGCLGLANFSKNNELTVFGELKFMRTH